METDDQSLSPPDDRDEVSNDTQGVDGAPSPVRLRDIGEWRGRSLLDSAGERIGPLEDVYYDVDTDEPMFATVKEGFFSRHLTFVPLPGASVGPESIHVAVTIDEVKEAPNIELSGEHLSPDDESTLYHHYRLNYEPSSRESGKRLVRH